MGSMGAGHGVWGGYVSSVKHAGREELEPADKNRLQAAPGLGAFGQGLSNAQEDEDGGPRRGPRRLDFSVF